MKIILQGVSGFSKRWTDVFFKTEGLEAQPAALVDINEKALAEVCAQYGFPKEKCFTTLKAALAGSEAEAVLVTVPTKFHYPETMAALSAGKHVLLEKPMAENLAQARKMAALAKKKKRILSIVSQHRFAPYLQTIKSYCRPDGPLGRPLTFFVRIHMNRPDDYYSHPLRSTGRGVLAIQGSHALDWITWLFGRAKCVSAALGTLYHKTKNEDNASAQIVMKNGVMVLFDINHFNKGKDIVEYTIYLEKGVLRYTPAGGLISEQGDVKTPVEFKNVNPQFDSLKEQLNNFVQACEGRAKLEVTAEDGLHVMEMLEGLYKSAKMMVKI